MNYLSNYLNDGACHAARATMAYLQSCMGGGIEGSWNPASHDYDGKPLIGRWENCREQGYVVYLRNKAGKQLNIAFFEHRNSDNICAIRWEQGSINSLSIDTAKFGDVYKDKYDVSKSVEWKEAHLLAKWIMDELTAFWDAGAKLSEKEAK